ncbi:MAG TPA: hypothetical protein PLA88_01395 [Bacteroidales bacterium]|nr:hypothetical protein [Bacteroidales bacterium]
MKRGLVLLLVICFSAVQYISAQNRQQLILTSKKDSSRSKNFTLPTFGTIKTSYYQSHYLRIIEVKNNQIIGLKNILSDSVLSDKNTQLLKQLEETGYRIAHDKSMKNKERNSKLDSLGLCFYADTVVIENSEISKLVLPVEHPSKFAATVAMTGFVISSFAFMIGMLGSINDSTMNPDPNVRATYRLVCIGGLVGGIGCMVWAHYISHNHFNMQKWDMKIKDIPFKII